MTFNSNRAGENDLWTKRADGSAQAVLELDGERDSLEALWSPDGEWLIYRLNPEPGHPGAPSGSGHRAPAAGDDGVRRRSGDALTGWALARVCVERGREGRRFTSYRSRTRAMRSGRCQRAEGGSPYGPTVAGSCSTATGRRDGRGAGRDGANVRARPAGGAVPGDGVSDRPKSPSVRCDAGRRERFIMIRQTGEDVAAGLIVVTNWFEELRERMGSN